MRNGRAHFEPGMVFSLCVIALVFLLQFAWRFADERLYADSGYYLFHVVNEGRFHVEHGRWVMVLAQAIPLLSVKLGLDMGPIIRLHSLSNVIILVGAMAYALAVLKDRRTALLVVMAQLVGLTHGLFCPVFELYYGVTLLLLFHATASAPQLNERARMVLSLLFFVGALSSHPMAWALLLGSIVLLDQEWRRPLLRPLLVTVLAFAVFRGLTMSAYESAQIAFIQRLAFPSLVLGLFKPDTLLVQIGRVLPHYPDVVALASFSAVVLWRNAQRRVAMIHMLGLLGLYILIGLYLPDPTHERYREQVDFGFTAWTLLIILSHTWSIERWRPILLIILVVCLAHRIVQATAIAPYYQARTQWERDHIARAHALGLQKGIIDPKGIAFGTVNDRVAPYWSTGIETLLLSAKGGPDRTVSVITTDDLQCPGIPEHLGKVVLRCWNVLEPGELNARYFGLSASRYAPLAVP